MTKKEKGEERVERIIRCLLKLPENRRCINCNSLGPQYVCTTFLTFVCTNCSGIHREFTHRVKSVSMAKFNPDEVSALQAGGNERARQIYFKDWDFQRNSYPDGSNLHRLRDFIKHVYVDRKYTGERSHEKLPRLRLGDREESYESRKVGVYCGGSRSPSYEDRHERSERHGPGGRSDDKSLKYYHDERRSPRYIQENSRYGGFKKSPARFEVVDDRFRDGGTQSARQSDSQRFVHRESRLPNRSPDHQKNMDWSSSPVVRNVKDILGENVPALQVGEHSKANDGKDGHGDGSARNQMITSSGNLASIKGNSVQQNSQNSESLIDLNTNSTPSDAAAPPQTQENITSLDGGNCSSYESFAKENMRPTPKPNTLELLLLELSASVAPADKVSEVPSNDDLPLTASEGNMLMSCGVSEAAHPVQLLTLANSAGVSTTASGGKISASSVSSPVPVGQMSTLPNNAGASTVASGANMFVGGVSPSETVTNISLALEGSMPVGGVVPAVPMGGTLTLLDTFDAPSTQLTTNLPLQPSNGGPLQASPDISGDSNFNVPEEQQLSSTQQHQPSALPAADGGSTRQQTTNRPVGTLNNQLLTTSNVANAQGTSNSLAEHLSRDVSKPVQDSNSGVPQPLPVETKSSGRKELPRDLFTASYSPAPGPIPGWQTGQAYGTGFSMQYYPNAMPVLAYPHPHPAKSTNPFDFNNETASAQAPPFPSMGNLRGALPSMSAPGVLLRTSSIGRNSSGLITTQSPSYASAVPPQSAFVSATSSGAYMGQVQMNMLPSRPQGAGGFGNDGVLLGSLEMTQQPSSGYSLPTSPNFLPSKGRNPFG